MPRIRVLIVDDEEPARERLLRLLQEKRDIEIAGVVQCGVEAVSLMKEREVDLLFLDIQMPGLDGFSTLRQIPAKQRPLTVFVTAYDKYALQAFESHAFDYLLKPFSDERFEAVLELSREYLQTKAASELGLRLAKLLDETDNGQLGSKARDQIILRDRGRVRFLNVKDLDWIEAAGMYVYLHVGSQSHIYGAMLGQLQERLNPRQFVRVNRSAIINAERILELQLQPHGGYVIVMKNGAQVPLSRGYRSQLEGWLHQSL
jgi:two-component system LytT family response regulator